MRNLAILCVIILSVSACSSNHEGIKTKLTDCGMGSEKYDKFQECAHKNLDVKSRDPNDYYAKSRLAVLSEIDSLESLVKKKKLKTSQAYQSLSVFIDNKILEEQQQSNEAAAIFTAMAVGVVLVGCANNGGCGGGGGYQSYYPGPCECPGDLDVNGNRCGARSAYSRSGGASPYCPSNRL